MRNIVQDGVLLKIYCVNNHIDLPLIKLDRSCLSLFIVARFIQYLFKLHVINDLTYQESPKNYYIDINH